MGVAVMVVGLLAPTTAAVRASATDSKTLTITSPAAPMVPEGDVTVRGALGSGSSNGTVVVFAVDQSGSTSSPRQDCSGDGVIDVGDDLNADGTYGDVLDCQIAGVVAMMTSFAGRGDVTVGLVGFGSSAAAADLSPDSGVQPLVPVASDSTDGGNRDRLPDLLNVASSMLRGRIDLFTGYSVGTGTSFTAALGATDAIIANEEQRRGNSAFNKFILFLSDGQASISASSSEIQRLSSRQVVANTYAVGAGTGGCGQTDPLRTISSTLNGVCTPVQDPSTLTAAIGNTAVDPVTVQLRNAHTGAVRETVDTTTNALGEYTAMFQSVPTGTWEAVARSGTLEATRTFSVRSRGSGIAYTALGDSYSSGEGAHPWRNSDPSAPSGGPRDDLDDACHRSIRGYPMQVRLPDQSIPIARASGSVGLFTFAACASAISQNLLYRPQQANGKEVPLQIDYLGSETDLVTATIGGNDIEFSQVAMHCITQANCQKRDGWGSDGFTTLNSGRTLTLPEYVDLRLAILAAQLPATYLRIKEATDYRATVIIAGYPELFQPKPSVLCSQRAVITREEREYLAGASARFNSLLSAATARAGVFYRPVIDEFRPHLPCGNQEMWLGGLATGISDKGKKLHPTDAGYAAYADMISQSLDGWTRNPPRGLKPNGLPHNPRATGATNMPAAMHVASTSSAVAEDTHWVDESLDPIPTMRNDILEGVDVDGITVGSDGTIVFDPWLAAALPDLPAITLEELRSVAIAAEPDLTLTSESAPNCIDTAAVGSNVVATASGFAPGSTVTLSSGGVEVESAVADSSGVAVFTTPVPTSGTTFTATGASSGFAASRASAAINALTDNPCVPASTNEPPGPTDPGLTAQEFCQAGTFSFPDVPLAHTHGSSISCLAALHIIRGLADGTFGPDLAVTRAQLASLFGRLVDELNMQTDDALEPLPTATTPQFSDVAPGSVHAAGISRLAEAGIVLGDGNGKFDPDGRASRAQIASMLARLHEHLTGNPFPHGTDRFNDDNQSVHEVNINAVAATGIITGTTPTTFQPEGDVTRAQIASLLRRLADYEIASPA